MTKMTRIFLFLATFAFAPQLLASDITVSAAISMKEPLELLAKRFEATQMTHVSLNLGSSGAILQQVKQGAPVDAFLSAGNDQMDELVKLKLIVDSSRKGIAGNAIALVTPKKNTAVTKFEDLSSEAVKKIAIGDVKTVPLGVYSTEVLQHLKLMEKLQSKFVYGTNAKQVLTYVESGNVDAALVYESDARSSESLRVVQIASSDSHSKILYEVALLKTSKQSTPAAKFLDFLQSSEAQDVFKRFHFTPL